MVQWYNGATVQRYNGATVHWYNGAKVNKENIIIRINFALDYML
jgi:hypothetical protein